VKGRGKRLLATTEARTYGANVAPEGMVALVDLLGQTAMEFMRDHEGVAARYVVEIKQDGSLMSLRSLAEPWDGAEAEPDPILPHALAAMYEQIAPSAEAYFAECGERPPLAADMYDRFAAAGFDMSLVERVTEGRRLQ
jgi:hypothetical protein